VNAIDTRPEVVVVSPPAEPEAAPSGEIAEPRARATRKPITPDRAIGLGLIWLVVTCLSITLVLYGLEPLFQERTQSQLLTSYRAEIERAANETGGLGGVTVPTKAPELGSAVAVLEIGKLKLQQVVVEGALANQTQSGPGHIPGTAAPGQPGNSVIIGRRGTFGAPFADLDKLETEDAIVVTTTQGQVVYRVTSVQQQTIGVAVDGADAVSLDDLYGTSKDDRLTLVTSAVANPANATRATVVVATLEGLPFPPTPQGGRTDSQSGFGGDPAAWPLLVLALLGFGLAAAGAVVVYRRFSIRGAYLVTTAPLIAFVILAAESASRLFPSWM
jgi:sortase A